MSKPCMGQDIFLNKPSGGGRTRGRDDDWEDNRGNGRSMRGWGRSRSPRRGGGDWESWGGYEQYMDDWNEGYYLGVMKGMQKGFSKGKGPNQYDKGFGKGKDSGKSGYEKGWGKSKGSRDGKGKGGGKDSKGKGKGKRERKPDVDSLDKELANYFGVTTKEVEKKSGASENLDKELDAYMGKKDEEAKEKK